MNLSDRRSYELHRLIAEKLGARPQWVIDTAMETLSRSRREYGSTAYEREWESLLRAGPQAVLEVLLDTGERGQRLRSSSPFTRILTQEERLAVLARVRNKGVERQAPQHEETPNAQSAMQRAIDFGIDPTMTLYNMFGLTPKQRLEKAGRTIATAVQIARWRRDRDRGR